MPKSVRRPFNRHESISNAALTSMKHDPLLASSINKQDSKSSSKNDLLQAAQSGAASKLLIEEKHAGYNTSISDFSDVQKTTKFYQKSPYSLLPIWKSTNMGGSTKK